ncbi:MAG: hypothetical protein KJ077_41350 [Anaerolineae bacterium]|nr:hypothetical protein [Anaerolineae bacterium]
MSADLTDEQKELIRWLAHEIGVGKLTKEFNVVWIFGGEGILSKTNFSGDSHPPITKPAFDALEKAGLLLCTPYIKSTISTATKYRKPKCRQRETHRRCALTRKAYEAIIANFDWLLLETRIVAKDEK